MSTSRLKVVVIGEPAVGKTSIIRRFTMNSFTDQYLATIALDFYAKEIEGTMLNIWDLSGHPEFFEQRGSYYKDLNILVLVFDITSRRTFDSLDMWINEANVFNQGDRLLLLCGNKIDIASQRAVPKNEAEYWARVRNMEYFEVSAHDGENIEHMFSACVSQFSKAGE